MYLDSAIIVKLLVREPDSDFFEEALDGELLSTSELSLAEVASALLSKERQKLISKTNRRSSLALFDQWIAIGQLRILTIDQKIYNQARRTLEICHPTIGLRSLDAIHISACEHFLTFPLCATDGRIRAAAKKLHIPIFPETLPT